MKAQDSYFQICYSNKGLLFKNLTVKNLTVIFNRYKGMIFILKLKFSYKMEARFAAPISNQHFTYMCVPKSTERQTIKELSVDIEPHEDLNHDTDCFGNIILYGCNLSPHQQFTVNVTGTAESGLNIYEEKFSGKPFEQIYKYKTPLTAMGKYLYEFYDYLSINEDLGDYEKAITVMRGLYNCFNYTKNVTDINTTAEQAMKLKRGVCQDYAHIMLALCRNAGLASRYVVGMLEGEGFSHAWVEVLCRGYWYGFDPTNNLLVDHQYVKISHGRDSSDCIVNKGIFKGCGSQSYDIDVIVSKEQ